MLSGLFVTLVVALAGAEGPPAELNDKTFAEWRDRIRPKADGACASRPSPGCPRSGTG